MKRKFLSGLLLIGILSCSISVTAAPKIYDNKEVFDAEYYATNNPDIVSVLGTDENVLLEHYLNYGKAEGRLGIDPNSDIYTKVVTPSAEALAKIADTSGDVLGIDYIYENYEGLDDLFIHYRLGSHIYDWEEEKFNINKSLFELHRTDFPDGLIDFDGNGIDDRDPINSMNVVDLNTNGTDDRSWGIANGKLYKDSERQNGESALRLCKHGLVSVSSDCYEDYIVCYTCIAEWKAEAEASTAKYKEERAIKLKLHDSKYSIGYQMQNAEKTHTFTYIGNMKWQRDDGTTWEAIIELTGEFKGWHRWVTG